MQVQAINCRTYLHQQNQQIATILKGCRKNNRDAQRELYTHFYGYGMSICLRYTENRQDAVEVLNDGFMRVFQYIRKFKLDKPFRPWFRKIMIHCAIDHLRKSTRLVETTLMEEGFDVGALGLQEERMSYSEMIGMVQKLPQAYRTVFNLIAIEGYKHEEVANMLDISVGTSKSNYHRAKRKLREYLKAYFIGR